MGCADWSQYKYGERIRVRSKFAPTPQAKPGDVEQGNASAEAERPRSQYSSSEEEEMELDEVAGVPDQKELEQDIDKERSTETLVGESEAGNGDRYLDASGLEKAER